MEKESLKILELFGGIGAIRKALINLNVNFKVVDYVEIDNSCVKSYNKLYGSFCYKKDIKGYNYEKSEKVDLLMHGSPCQDFSAAGKKLGVKNNETRSSLLFETLRIVENMKDKPKWIIWENVPTVLNKFKSVLDEYIEKLKKLGYETKFKILNSNEFGIPQNRRRVFVISFLGKNLFDFENLEKKEMKDINDFLEKDVSEIYTVTQNSILKQKNTKKFRIIKNKCFTITTKQTRLPNAGIIDLGNNKYRYLTEKECLRLMGFSDEDYTKLKELYYKKNEKMGRIYRQAGNSIVVNVLEAILKEIINIENQQNKENQEVVESILEEEKTNALIKANLNNIDKLKKESNEDLKLFAMIFFTIKYFNNDKIINSTKYINRMNLFFKDVNFNNEKDISKLEEKFKDFIKTFKLDTLGQRRTNRTNIQKEKSLQKELLEEKTKEQEEQENLINKLSFLENIYVNDEKFKEFLDYYLFTDHFDEKVVEQIEVYLQIEDLAKNNENLKNKIKKLVLDIEFFYKYQKLEKWIIQNNKKSSNSEAKEQEEQEQKLKLDENLLNANEEYKKIYIKLKEFYEKEEKILYFKDFFEENLNRKKEIKNIIYNRFKVDFLNNPYLATTILNYYSKNINYKMLIDKYYNLNEIKKRN